MTGLLVALLPATGCMTAAKQAYFEMRGAQGEVLLLTEPAVADSHSFGGVFFLPATTTVSDRVVPPELLTAFNRRASRIVEDIEAAYVPGEKRLSIATDVTYFQSKGLFSPAMLLARVYLRDADRLVQDTIVKVESKAFRAGDEKDLADAALNAIRAHVSAFLESREAADRKRRETALRERRQRQGEE
ncbi:MAG: hypothetical protein IPM64_06645 [Phycisphaerales bacterium]|nr:hypothetical protein [Phycisphaerales bacterium]